VRKEKEVRKFTLKYAAENAKKSTNVKLIETLKKITWKKRLRNTSLPATSRPSYPSFLSYPVRLGNTGRTG
jgi:hypothetical protein